MPIPLSEGIKGFDSREFEPTFSVASSAKLREDCGAFYSPDKSEKQPGSLDRVGVVG